MNHFELATALRTVTSKMNKVLRKKMQSVGQLSVTEITTMSNLYHQDRLSPSQMAEMVRITIQSMSEIIRKLQGHDLIVKTPSQDDKRMTFVSLSEKGKKFVELTRNERDRWLAGAIEQDLTTAEQETLAQAIKIIEKLSDHEVNNSNKYI